MNRMVQMTGYWSTLVFGRHTPKLTPKVRSLRVLEEVIELCQAEGVTVDEINVIRDQVMNKPAGEAILEFRGVMTTLMAYAWTCDFDPEDEFWHEFMRLMQPEMMEKVRNRNLGGDKIGIEV